MTIGSGSNTEENNGFNVPAGNSLTGHIYIDANGNGKQDPDESDLVGAKVLVTDANGVAQTVTTDANGNYTATGLGEGEATVKIDESTLPAGATQTEGTNPTTVTIGSGSNEGGNSGFKTVGPIANNDKKSGTAGVPTTLSVLSNDVDSDGDIETSTVNITTAGARDTDGDGDSDELIVTGEGTWIVDPSTGDITFTPEEGFTGDPTPITYNVSDDRGNVSNNAVVTISYEQTTGTVIRVTQKVGNPMKINTIIGESMNPETVNIDPASVPNGVGVDTDNDGDIDKVTVPGEGIWTVDNAGIMTFTPEEGFIGDPTPISYTVTDNDGVVSSPISITIDYLQEMKVNDDRVTAKAGMPVTVNVLEDDTSDYPFDLSTLRIIDPETNASVTTLVVPNEGEWKVNDDGTILFTPEEGFTGNPTPVEYTIRNTDGAKSKLASITIIYEQDMPATKDRNITIAHYGATMIDAATNGKIEIASQPAHGTVIFDDHGTPNDPTDDIFVFTPEANIAHTVDKFTYTITDADGNSHTVTVTLNIICASTQTSDSGAALNMTSMLMMILMTMMAGLFFRREEENTKKEA